MRRHKIESKSISQERICLDKNAPEIIKESSRLHNQSLPKINYKLSVSEMVEMSSKSVRVNKSSIAHIPKNRLDTINVVNWKKVKPKDCYLD